MAVIITITVAPSNILADQSIEYLDSSPILYPTSFR